MPDKTHSIICVHFLALKKSCSVKQIVLCLYCCCEWLKSEFLKDRTCLRRKCFLGLHRAGCQKWDFVACIKQVSFFCGPWRSERGEVDALRIIEIWGITTRSRVEAMCGHPVWKQQAWSHKRGSAGLDMKHSTESVSEHGRSLKHRLEAQPQKMGSIHQVRYSFLSRTIWAHCVKSDNGVVIGTEHLEHQGVGVSVRQHMKLLWSYDVSRARKGKACIFLAGVKWWKRTTLLLQH